MFWESEVSNLGFCDANLGKSDISNLGFSSLNLGKSEYKSLVSLTVDPLTDQQ
jgi:hypothetical protein